MKNCIIIHGGPLTDTPENPHNLHTLYWHPWTKVELIKRNIETLVPAMPHPWNPKYQEYKEVMDNLPITEDSVLVGHSRGVAFLLRWLGDTKQTVRKIIMVAPNLRTESTNLELQNFYDFDIDDLIKQLAAERTIFTSETDDLENMESAKLLAGVLDCKVINLPQHGHFITQEMGRDEFPELIKEILG
jgi:predicted alpha/beta hydrolase family esterase